MKKNNYLVLLICIISFASCKKENDIVNNDPVVPVAPNERLLLASSDTYNTYSFE